MGQAKLRLMEAAIKMEVNFDKVDYHISKVDYINFAKVDESTSNPEKVNLRVTRFVINNVIQLAFKDGMQRLDRKNWAAWQECFFNDDEDPSFEVTISMVRWLRLCLSRDDLKTPFMLSQWLEALIDYFDLVIEEVTKENAN